MPTRRRGFSLIELLIVIAIILIIAAVAIPNLLDARRAAQEMASVRALTTINTAQVQYFSTYGRYAQSLVELGPPVGRVASRLTRPHRYGNVLQVLLRFIKIHQGALRIPVDP